ncbi:helix-turn-helix domain-containing protein, partial [Flavobacterium covae]
MSTLGERIQQLRKANNITQQDLGSKINISHPQIVRYETKGVQPPADVLNKLAEV